MMTPEEQIRMTLLLETMLKSAGVYDEVIDCMKAYALHVLERVEKETEELSGHVTYPDGSTERYISSYNLKQIFEERKKELNGKTETRQTFDCKVCGKPFGDKLSLYNHYDEEHNRE